MGQQDIIILKRQELYAKVWETPMIKLCRLYNLSDNGLRKICKKMNIPTPYAGYWAIVQNGRKAKVIPLPVADSKTVLEYKVDPEKERTPMKIFSNLPEVKVSKDLMNPHPLIKNVILYKRDNKSIDPKFVIPLSFSKVLESRGMLLLNTLFYELEKRNCIITCNQSNFYGKIPTATKDGESVHFHLYEQTKAHKIEKPQFMDPRYEYTFLGLLQLKIEGYYWERVRMTYSEGAKRKMEDLLPAVINGIITALEYKKAWTLQQEEKRREEERIRTIRENEEKRKAEEKRKWELLQDMATQLNTYDSIQVFISKIRLNYINEISTNIKLGEWLNWAEQRNEKNNPIGSIAFLSKFGYK